MTKEFEDFESFLKNVDEISDLVKDLNSSDVTSQQRAVEKADCYISTLKEKEEPCKTLLNRTVINTNRSQQAPAPTGSQNDPSSSADHFMKMMESDAEDRHKRRQMRQEKANALKEKGNEAYAQGEYETAVKLYSDGLDERRDMQPLYTNRAQSYIKLEKYKEAISDCEWALKCNDKCVKAYLHMGKAHLALENYNESRMCYQKILEIEPGREKMLKEYLTQVDLEEERECQESKAWEEFDKGEEKATTVLQLLKKLDRPDQFPLYYCGGLKLLSHAITDCTGQTLFRLNNGFSIIQTNDTVRSCLLQKSTAPCAEELCVSVLKLWRVVCDGNDENQKMLMRCPASEEYIVDLLASGMAAVRKECLAFLSLYSQTPHGRCLAIENLNLHMLVGNLMGCISTQSQLETTALTILENFATENQFCLQLRDTFTTLIGLPFASLLRNITTFNRHSFPSLISTIGNMIGDDAIHNEVANCQECWQAFLIAMKWCTHCEYREILYPLLGLMINLSGNSSTAIQEHAVPISGVCLDLLSDPDGGIITRATGLLSKVLPQSTAATEDAVQRGVVGTMRRLLKGSGKTTTKYLIKTLTVCTAISQTAQEEWVKCDKRLHTLRRLLGPSSEEAVAGNAALCLGHCLGVRGAASSLLGTDTVLLLLRHAAGDAKRSAVQQNSAITLGKLCKAEPRHMAKLRELHGLEILHSCMKLIT
ncbi:tetratricopeptide repeat protein 12 isoform X1 [Salvelinus sp. IW2-2015]|uniref:tetratricopeptide repeat protein 12 isoform X1 n=1 Tax=Salvelinus sp. IW2-2015 TaxID=2691554 RepID=UPI000CDF65B5|nr:tetratricopeptide repeat protein 12 isoform X1 [Salvelinus alpinus]